MFHGQSIVLRSTGKPVSKADECKVVDPETHEEVQSGQVGEMWCRGPYTVRGYYNHPNVTKRLPRQMDTTGQVIWSRRIEFIDELPITKIGKYEKKRLRERITEKLKNEGKI